jgi:hypothetical protein
VNFEEIWPANSLVHLIAGKKFISIKRGSEI